MPDPGAQTFFGTARWISGIEIPSPVAEDSFYEIKDVPHGDVRSVLYFSKVTGKWRRCFVYTPPDYDKDPNKRFPVLYLQHGYNENETGWGHQGCAGFILDNLIAEGKVRPFIVVMENGGIALGGNRPAAGGRGPGAPTRGNGRGGFDFSAFEHALIEDVIPYMDANFRTIPDQPHRALAGLSMGGMQTHTISLAHIDTFSHIGMFSGGSIATNEIADMTAFKQKVKLVFVSYGSRENGAMGKTNVMALKEAGINSVYYESPNTAHEWQTWRRSLHEFAPLLFKEN